MWLAYVYISHNAKGSSFIFMAQAGSVGQVLFPELVCTLAGGCLGICASAPSRVLVSLIEAEDTHESLNLLYGSWNGGLHSEVS